MRVSIVALLALTVVSSCTKPPVSGRPASAPILTAPRASAAPTPSAPTAVQPLSPPGASPTKPSSGWDDCEPPTNASASLGPEGVGEGEVGEGLESPNLKIVIFSVGQADSMLVLGNLQGTPKSVLIDLGEPVSAEGAAREKYNFEYLAQRLSELLPKSKRIDYFILSHFHKDHAGQPSKRQPTGIFGLVETTGFKIENFIHPGSDNDGHFGSAARAIYNGTMRALNEWVKDGKVKRARAATVGDVIDLGGGTRVEIASAGGKVTADDSGTLASIVSEHGDVYSEGPPSENDLSIALFVRQGVFELFTAGDLTGASDEETGEIKDYTRRTFPGGKVQIYSNVEKRLTQAWTEGSIETDVELYRANHHGSQHSSTPALIGALDPEFVVYSAGGDYGHPSAEVVARASETARQFVTTRLDERAWDVADFSAQRGRVLGRDITVKVSKRGTWYTLNNELHKAYNDNQERSDADKGEENNHWELP